MAKSKDEIVQQKEFLATEALKVGKVNELLNKLTGK